MKNPNRENESSVIPTFWYKDSYSEVAGKLKDISLKCYLILPKFYIIKNCWKLIQIMCLTWDFRLNMLDRSNFLAHYVIYISAIALHISLLWSYVCVRMKQMYCRELYIHLSPVNIQICPTMNNNDQQWITMMSSWETSYHLFLDA